MSLMYRTLLMTPSGCTQYVITNGNGASDTIEVSYINCGGFPDTVTLTSPNVIVTICSSTVPNIDLIVGGGTVVATGSC